MSSICGDSQDIRNHFHRDGAVPALVDLVAAGRRRKRPTSAFDPFETWPFARPMACRFLDEKAMTGSIFLTEISCGLLKWIDLMKERQWKDGDQRR
jgi:hypothetical protein